MTEHIHTVSDTNPQDVRRMWRPHRIVLPLGAALLLTSSTAIAQSTALVGATVIDGTGKPGIPNAVVVVTRDRLTCVATVPVVTTLAAMQEQIDQLAHVAIVNVQTGAAAGQS